MIELQTPRLLLVSTPLEVLETRLSHHAFEADVPFGKELVRAHFPPEWPGDALAIFPAIVQEIKSEADSAQWSATIIERTERVAVGQIGFKAPPDEHGSVELGYGISPAYQNRGYATEAARALVAWALEQPTVRRVSAECLEDNWESVRVLEKVGFRRVGRRMGEEGLLLLWVSTLIHLRANLPERPTYALWGTPYGGVTAVTLVWVNAEVLYVGPLIKKYNLTPLCQRREEEPNRDRSDGNPHGNYGVLPAG